MRVITQTLLCLLDAAVQGQSLQSDTFQRQPLRGTRDDEGPVSLSKAGAFWAVPCLPSDTEMTFQESSVCAEIHSA